MHTIRVAIVLLGVFIFPLATASDDRLAEMRDMLAEALHEKHPGQRLDELVANGLDHSDSEEVLIQLNKAISTCLLAAIREYSFEMSLDFDDQLDLLEADLKEGVAGKYFSSLDQEKLKQIVYPCFVAAHQAAGLEAPNSLDQESSQSY